MGLDVKPVDKTNDKNQFSLINILFTFTLSILALLLGKSNLGESFMGSYPTFRGLMESAAFLVVWLLFGVVMGYTKKKGFMKFISVYWGIGGAICLTAFLMAPIGKLTILAIPVFALILVPTYGLTFLFMPMNSNYIHATISITSSWSAGAIGYLLGYLIKKLRVSTLFNK